MRMRNLMAAVAVGALLPALALGQTGVFRAAYTASGEGNPTGIGVGDFDNDGTLDVVTCNSGTGIEGNALNVLIGFNDGTLSEVGPSIPLNSFPSGLLQGKFDADQIDDLIVAKANDNAVVFVKGLKTPDFFDPPGPLIAVGQSPIAIASADIDGNGTPDLVVANEGGDSSPGSISVLLGQGDGSFVLQVQPDPSKPGETVDNLPADLGTRAVAIGNIDAEAGLDVLALNTRSSSISVYTSDGHGIFTPRDPLPTGAAPQDLALIDLNGDGKLDLVVATSNDDAVTVQLGNGNRTFAAAQSHPVGTAPNRLKLGDVNNDGKLDITATNSRSGDLSVLLGDGHGGFGAARTFVADAEPQVLTLGDFNNDGLIEPATATQGSDTGPSVAVPVNRGQGVLHAVEDIRVGGGPSAVAVADLDGDGLSDMLVGTDDGQAEIFPGRANGFGDPIALNIGGRALGVAAADLNGDARPDIVVVDTLNSRVAVSLSQGGGRFAAAALYSTAAGPGSVIIGDFNGDDRPDIAVTAIGAERFCQGGPEPGKACGQDNDCAPDGTCTAPGKASVLLQQSNGQFGPARNTTVEETPIGIATVDANCDGKDDLLIANQASSTVSVLRSNGDGTFTNAQTLPQSQVGQNPIALAVADFNRDGTTDFVVTNTVAPLAVPNVHLFRGNCSGPFTPFTNGQVHVGELASAIVARDFTGDQIVDLALVSQTSNAVYLLTGVGDGTVRPSGNDAVSRMPIAVAAGDLDGDGRYDAVTANNDPSANNLSVLFNCARDLTSNHAPANCDPFGRNGPPGTAALRGDANGDGVRSAADLVAVAAEVMDGDGFQVEAIEHQRPGETVPGVDANGDGRVDAQDRLAVAHRVFGG
jgi:hypothetical protein